MRKPVTIPAASPERARELLLISGLPPAYRDWTFDTFDVTDANREAFEIVSGWTISDRSLYIGGVSGAGKTRLACGLVLKLIDQGVVAKFINVPAFLEQCFLRDEDDRPDLERLIQPELCAVLVLDDIGMSVYQGWKADESVRVLYRLINGRIENGVPFVTTTNLPMEEMRRRLGDPVTSRIMRESEIVTVGKGTT